MNALLRVEGAQRWSYVATASLTLLAWSVLVVWSLSPYAKWLDHAQMDHIAAPLTIRLAIFALGWILMVVAMMLPGTLLLLTRCLGNEPLSARRTMPLIVPYLTVWTVFGSLSYWGDTALHEYVEHHSVLAGAIAPGVVLLAGVYQMTPLKRAYVAKCRLEDTAFTSMSPPRNHQLWLTGLRHGLYCLGSCWALMLLMFALGGVNLAWMVILGAVMAVERLSRRGKDLTKLVGVVLILAAFVLVIV